MSTQTDDADGGRAKAFWMRVRPLIARYRRNPLFKGVSRFCQLWLKAYENCNGVFTSNGEEMIIRSLVGTPVETVFDVGSNFGEWSLLVHRHLPAAKVYAFELSPPTFASLVENVRRCPAVQCFNFGLSDVEAEAEIFHYPDKPGETSLLAHPFQAEAVKLKGRLRTGDTFCAENAVTRIDLLKIDVEGMESAVLRGFDRMLAGKKISVIQFEYEKLNVMTKFLLKDFYALLGGYGYVLGKVYPTYVDFRDYKFDHELAWGTNYLAVVRDRADLLARFPR